MPPPPPTATLTEELVEEILLRIPPHEPAWLVFAALVCKLWHRLICAPRFRRRYREFHRTPPLLGFLCNVTADDAMAARFVPTAASCAAQLADGRRCIALDARHGRVLLLVDGGRGGLAVWNPIAGEQRDLPMPVPARQCPMWNAAVLCAGAAAGTCDHLDCHRGPFVVVFAGIDGADTLVCTYSSEAAAWSEPVATQHPDCILTASSPIAFVGNAIFISGYPRTKTALKYDLQLRQLSWIQLPVALFSGWQRYVFTSTECGGLGLAAIKGSELHMWTKSNAPEADNGWTQTRAIALETLLPVNAILTPSHVIAFAEGVGKIFIRGTDGVYTIDIKTYKAKKVYKCRTRPIHAVVPYMSFCLPADGGGQPAASGQSSGTHLVPAATSPTSSCSSSCSSST